MWIRISQLILTIKNIALIGVGIGLCIALINSLVNFGFIAWANIQGYSTYSLLIEEIITFFLYLYIGITAIVRLLIIDHESALDMLLWSISILVLVCCLVLVEKFLNNKS